MTYRLLMTTVLAALCAFPASADIGAIGSPVTPSNAENDNPVKDATAEPEAEAPVAVAETRKPLLVIRFNQARVYFDRMLGQAVRSAEKAKPGVNYDVVSYIPAGNSPNAGANLSAVMQNLQELGVSASRINSRVQTDGTLKSQEIRIFVK